MGNYTLTTLGAATELLDLPFDVPLAEWTDQRLVQVPRGISRHVVRFVRVHTEIFAIKEANERYVLREHRLLHELSEKSVPVVDAFGTVVDRSDAAGEPLQALLITRHLPFSLPYRSLFTGRGLPDLRSRLLAVEHAVPPRRRCTRCVSRRRGDRRDAPAAVPRSALARHHDRYREHRRRAVRPAGRGLRRRHRPGRDGDGARAALRATVGRTGQRRGGGPRRELPDQPAHQASERARLRRLRAGYQFRGGRAQAAVRYPRRRAGPPPAAPVRTDRPSRAGEPGTRAAG